jgi:hypothetical protein
LNDTWAQITEPNLQSLHVQLLVLGEENTDDIEMDDRMHTRWNNRHMQSHQSVSQQGCVRRTVKKRLKILVQAMISDMPGVVGATVTQVVRWSYILVLSGVNKPTDSNRRLWPGGLIQ